MKFFRFIIKYYFYYNPQEKKSGLTVTSNLLLVVGIILFIIGIAVIVSSPLDSSKGIIAVIAVLLIIVAAIIGSVGRSMLGEKYKNYISQDTQYRYLCNSKVGEYNEKSAQFQRLEHTLRDPSVCVLPVQLWNNAEEIIGYVKSGKASTITEAVTRLGFMQ